MSAVTSWLWLSNIVVIEVIQSSNSFSYSWFVHPKNKNITMRVMDFYHHDEGKIRENWVPIDLIHILKQIDIDVLELIK